MSICGKMSMFVVVVCVVNVGTMVSLVRLGVILDGVVIVLFLVHSFVVFI